MGQSGLGVWLVPVRVMTLCCGSVRVRSMVGASFQIFALTAKGMSWVEREIFWEGQMFRGNMSEGAVSYNY